MKKLLVCLSMVAALYACGGSSETESAEEEDEPGFMESVSALKNIADEAEAIEEDGDKLKNTTPLDNEKLKALLPDELHGLPRQSFSIGMPGYVDLHTANAGYNVTGEDTNIQLSIIDGAGETGSAFASMIRLSLAQDYEKNDEYGYEKTSKVDGRKIIEKLQKDTYSDMDDTEISLFVGNRFMVKLEASGIGIDALKETLDELHLDELEELADS